MLDTAVIPCGGLGRRLRPITQWVPKEMLPVGLKPLLLTGTLGLALQYPILAEVRGLDQWLLLLVVVTAIGEVLYRHAG